MIRTGIYCINLLLLLSQMCNAEAETELSSMMVYKLLSMRIDTVVYETNDLKFKLEETKAVVERIEQTIERINASVSAIAIKTVKYEKENSKTHSNEKDQSNLEESESQTQRQLRTQAILLRKVLGDEKAHLRKTVEKFENKMKTFESDIKEQLTWMNDSFESSLNIINHSIADRLNYIENKVQNSDNQTSEMIQEINANIENAFIESQTNVSKVLSIVNSLPSADRLNSAERKLQNVSSKLDRQNEAISIQISVLSSRIAEEEARKVAFSARMTTKQITYVQKEKLVFDSVMYSHGGGYSSSTGIFTAPKSGTYLFTFNVQARYDGKAHVLLMHEMAILTRAIAESDDINVTGGNAGIVYVETGEKVWIQAASVDDEYQIWPYRTTFNGILID